MSINPFRSTGTIRVRSEPRRTTGTCARTTGTCARTTKIFFNPGDASTVRHGGKMYAVFIRGDGDNACLRSKPLDDSDEGVPIKVEADLPGLIEAAVQQILVEVAVNSDWTLHAITIPASGRKK